MIQRRIYTLVLFAACLVGFVGMRSVHAGFEIPYIDSTNAPANVEMRGIWMFNRGFSSFGSSFSGFEAYAVGIDLDKKTAANAPDTENNGLFYYYNGVSWMRMPNYRVVETSATTHATTTLPAFQPNAVAGQDNSGNGNPYELYMVGSNGHAAYTYSLLGRPGDPTGPSYGTVNYGPAYNTFKDFKVQTSYNDTTPVDISGYDLYAVDAAQSYFYAYLIGGQRGMVLTGAAGALWPIHPAIQGDSSARSLYNGTDGVHAAENVTGIRYVNLSTAYVVTSTFADGDRYADSGKNCAGTQTTRLYKTITDASWQFLGSTTGCAYGIAIGSRPTASTDHGPSQNILWLASNRGVLKYDEKTGGAISVSQATTQPVYSVMAVPDRGGKNINLLYNGDFENWSPSPAADTNPPANATNSSKQTNSPDSWVKYEPSYNRNNSNADGTFSNPITPADGAYDAGSCSANRTNEMKRVPGFNGLGSALQIFPGAPFTNSNCTGFNAYFTYAAFNRINLTTTEGQTFEVSGDYKVEFPTAPYAAGGVDAGYQPVAPQGGVFIGCTGIYDRESAQYIDCSLNNRSQIRTKDNPTNGWVHFDIIVSRQDSQFRSVIATLNNYAQTLLPRKMLMEVRCQATYGAKVTCDNLQVKEITKPATPAHDTFTVVAVGAKRSILVNPDGLNSSAFTVEQQPAFTDVVGAEPSYLATFGVASQHVMVAGEASTLLSRTPSTLTGYIWAGSGDSATNAGVGYISVSCINTKTGSGSATQTLCQSAPSSYGLSMNYADVARTKGTLIGRAWFGKNVGSSSDAEQVNAGTCLRNEPLQDVVSPTSPYSQNGMCNTVARRCYASHAEAAKGTTLGALSNYTCLSDFDCYGRCSGDQGRLCVTDADCHASSVSPSSVPLFNPGQLSVAPAARLGCSISNPAACTSTGWLSFNASDFSSADAITPDNKTLGVQYNVLNTSHNSSAAINNSGAHELSGWARFTTLASLDDPNYQAGKGWVSFRGPSVSAAPVSVMTDGAPVNSLIACQDCYGSNTKDLNCAYCVDSAQHSCTPSNAVLNAGTPQQHNEAACHYVCQTSGASCFNDFDCGPTGGSCRPVGYCTGDMHTICQSDTDCSLAGGYCNSGVVCSAAGASCVQYGVTSSTQNGSYSGMAWSSDFGWLGFRGVTQAQSRFFQTRLGSIYATGDVGNPLSTQPAGTNNCNATFLILSGGTAANNWCSAIENQAGYNSRTDVIQSNVTPIQLPSSANIYQNILGRFDLTGMETVLPGGKNKYGSPIVSLTVPANHKIATAWQTAITNASPSGSLGGRVYIAGNSADAGVSGAPSAVTYSLESAMKIYNSSNLTTDGTGAGMLIVEGNLTINAGLSYALTGNIDDLRKLQNLIIVVKGDLTIDNFVQSIVGSFYVTGTVHTTSSTTNANQYPLVARGLMIAHNFDFGRKFAGTVENPAPSELIIADGRIQSNPMPGMTDFVKSLPSLAVQP